MAERKAIRTIIQVEQSNPQYNTLIAQALEIPLETYEIPDLPPGSEKEISDQYPEIVGCDLEVVSLYVGSSFRGPVKRICVVEDPKQTITEVVIYTDWAARKQDDNWVLTSGPGRKDSAGYPIYNLWRKNPSIVFKQHENGTFVAHPDVNTMLIVYPKENCLRVGDLPNSMSSFDAELSQGFF